MRLKFGDRERVLPLHLKGMNSMTEMDSVHKTDSQTHVEARRAFLKALYADSPDDLYLELRCIHPATGEVKTFWSRIGDKQTLTTAFKRADELNHDGYGIYFAPCLRSQMQGKAEVAALLPALWVDMDFDGNTAIRAAALAKLHAFNPPPSAIIDSGGGLHTYWLLSEPVTLDEGSRKQAAWILRGLFSALGGDPQYVKSVASVMRLPGSINTKPERGGAVVTLVELHPDRRYPLSDFTWLESQPQVDRVGSLNVVTLNGNGHHPLPRRTEDYLAAGATEGSRNTELFQAACQLRDAGYSQSDTEAQLVPRHIADRCSEREALATISSAYSRPPREPLLSPRQTAQEQVNNLLAQYQRTSPETERPTVAQIQAAVVACATLSPLEWAEERKRLKPICGDTFRTEDLNLMYRQARRDNNRETKLSVPSGLQYHLDDHHMILERPSERGPIRQIIAEWSGQITDWLVQIADEGQSEHVMRLNLQQGAHRTSLDVPSELFGDANALQRFIAQRAGAIYTTCAGMHRHLPAAILKLSDEFPTRQSYRFMGWTQINRQWVYVSPGCSLGTSESIEAAAEVELETRLRDYGLTQGEINDGLAAFQAAIPLLPVTLAPALLAFTVLPLIQRFFPQAAPKPAIHLVGTTGSGKSEIAALMTSFYGQFSRDQPPAQWGDTVNTVELLGYSLADALFWVDDYKSCYADERTFTRFLQSYSRGMGRGRLTREARLRQEKPCRGLLLSTGETTIEGEASVLARMLVLEVPPWEQRDPGGKALGTLDGLRHALPIFTAALACWIAAQADAGTLHKTLADGFETSVEGYRDRLKGQVGKQANSGRMIQNWAVLVTSYRLLACFLRELDADDCLPAWQDCLLDTIQAVQSERAGQVFIRGLEQLLASGEAILTDLRNPDEPRPGITIVGYRDGQMVYLLPEVSYRVVERITDLKFTVAAIGSQLREDGWLVPGGSENHLTTQIRVRGGRVRVWRMKATLLGGDDGASGDRVAESAGTA
jgi:hypothetical protein